MSNHLLIFVLLVGVAYGGLEAWPLIKGPGIELYSPLQNATYQDGTVTVKGVAKRVSGLSLNGAPLFYEEKKPGIDSTALIDPSVILGKGVFIDDVQVRWGKK